MQKSDRREFQRLGLASPILATVRSSTALVLDLGFGGAFLEHYGTAEPGERFNLAFRWQGEALTLACEVVRSEIVEAGAGTHRDVSHTGVRFVEPDDRSCERLSELIAVFVGKILAAQKANASGTAHPTGKSVLAKMGAARRMRSRGFVSYRLKGKTWWRIPTSSALQPDNGFTVGAHEDEEEIDTLCRSYLSADEEGRRLIRLVAELSLQAPKE